MFLDESWQYDGNMLFWLMTFTLFKADVAPMPDVLWPNAKEILCSAVSRCTRYVALGLDDALVCVWDRRTGEQILHLGYLQVFVLYCVMYNMDKILISE